MEYYHSDTVYRTIRQCRRRHARVVAFRILRLVMGLVCIATAAAIVLGSAAVPVYLRSAPAALIIGAWGFLFVLVTLPKLARDYRRKARDKSRPKHRMARSVAQKLVGIFFLSAAGVQFYLGYNSQDILTRDCTAAVLFTVFGLYLIFTKETIWS